MGRWSSTSRSATRTICTCAAAFPLRLEHPQRVLFCSVVGLSQWPHSCVFVCVCSLGACARRGVFARRALVAVHSWDLPPVTMLPQIIQVMGCLTIYLWNV